MTCVKSPRATNNKTNEWKIRSFFAQQILVYLKILFNLRYKRIKMLISLRWLIAITFIEFFFFFFRLSDAANLLDGYY